MTEELTIFTPQLGNVRITIHKSEHDIPYRLTYHFLLQDEQDKIIYMKLVDKVKESMRLFSDISMSYRGI
jgi:hypothetical protein